MLTTFFLTATAAITGMIIYKTGLDLYLSNLKLCLLSKKMGRNELHAGPALLVGRGRKKDLKTH